MKLSVFFVVGLELVCYGQGFRHHQRTTGPADYQEVIKFQSQFAGSGSVGIMARGMNSVASGTFGACNISTTIAERVGPALYVMVRQMTNGAWFGYEADTYESGANVSPPNIRAYSIYKPMKRILYSNGAVSDGDGGAVVPQITSSQLWVKGNVGSISSAATRLGIIFGLGANNDGLVRVSITNASGTVFTPNLLPTAQQLVDAGHLTNTALVAGGGTLDPTDRVIGSEITAIGWSGGTANRYHHIHIPIADSLAAGAYIVTVDYTPYGYMQDANATDRFYLIYFTYGDDTMAPNDSGVTLSKMGWWTGENDSSANETYTMECRPAGSGSYTILGGDHGNEFNTTDPVITLDGTQIYLHARTATRARTSNVATIVTGTPHGLTTADLATISGSAGTGYNAEGVSVTVVNATTFTYASTGSNEATTADTAGRVMAQKVFLGNKLTLARDTHLLHPNFQTGTGTVATASQTYTLDKFGIQTAHTITTSTSLDINTQTYAYLSSVWSGTAKGPQWGGQENYRRLGSRSVQGTNDLSNVANTSIDSGAHNGYVIWSSTNGKATVMECDTLVKSTSNWANSSSYLLQDRIGDTLFKAYLSATGAILLAQSSGLVFTGSSRRFDAVFADADSVCR
jgi:hypothetical protein